MFKNDTIAIIQIEYEDAACALLRAAAALGENENEDKEIILGAIKLLNVFKNNCISKIQECEKTYL